MAYIEKFPDKPWCWGEDGLSVNDGFFLSEQKKLRISERSKLVICDKEKELLPSVLIREISDFI